MARVSGERDDSEERSGREERESERSGQRGRDIDPAPKVTVLGYMDGNLALRLGWKHGMQIVSNSRFKFMRDDLGMDVTDNTDDYLF